MHQVSFAESDAAVDVKRIVSFSRRFGDGERSRMSKLIARADNESAEHTFRIERKIERFNINKVCGAGRRQPFSFGGVKQGK